MASLTLQSETTRVNYVEYVGDTLRMAFAYKEGTETGPLIDLFNYDIFMEVKALLANGEPTGDALIRRSSTEGSISVLGLEENIVTQLEAADTSLLGPGEFGYAIVLVRRADNYVNTLIRGKIILKVR